MKDVSNEFRTTAKILENASAKFEILKKTVDRAQHSKGWRVYRLRKNSTSAKEPPPSHMTDTRTV